MTVRIDDPGSFYGKGEGEVVLAHGGEVDVLFPDGQIVTFPEWVIE